MISKRIMIATLSALLCAYCAASYAQEKRTTGDTFEIGGILQQGGFVRGRIPAGSNAYVQGKLIPTSSTGHFILGLDRDAPGKVDILLRSDSDEQAMTLSVAPRTYREGQVISGLNRNSLGRPVDDPLGPDDLFPAEDEAAIATRSARSPSLSSGSISRAEQSQKKSSALQSRADIDGFMEDWTSPFDVPYPISSPWGAARTVRGNPRIHYGVDIAAPLGADIKAPASGVVTLAATDYYYEGGVVFIDHGLGLTSIYLHMSEVDVSEGDVVEQGELLGKVGAEGRATGAHLCWRLYWNGREIKLDPQGF